MLRRIPVALTIAGSDSGGGAGIQADLKTFAALGVHGTTAITSITAQNTLGVRGVHDLPGDFVAKQIEVVAEDLGVDAAKTGMLSNEEIIRAVARSVRRYGFPLVVDPVMVAKSGDPLLRPEAVDALKSEVIPLAKVVTPNRMEAERLSGVEIRGLEDAKKAARVIANELGPEAVVVKGGHISGDESVDVMYYRGSYRIYRSPRIAEGCFHGTGCSFSAAIAAELAKGKPLEEAVRVAKEFIATAITYGLKVGRGHCPVNPQAWVLIPAERYRVIENVSEALNVLLANQELVVDYAPEVGINVVMALPYPYARGVGDVAGIPGRVMRVGSRLQASGHPAFGASRHMARAVLSMMRFFPELRAGVNVAYSEELVKAAEALGYRVSYYDRREEPPEVKAKEGATIPWGIEVAVRRLGGARPDIVYHLGDWGKEAMIEVFGETALDAVNKLLTIARAARGR